MSTSATQVRPNGQLVFPGVVALVAVFVLAQAGSIVTPVSAGALGPRVLPYLVGGAMLAASLSALAGAARGHGGTSEAGEDVDPDAHTDWRVVVLLVALVGVHIVLITPVGWPIAAAVLFTGAAWTFGARPRLRAAVIGTTVAFLLQVVFGWGLGVSLPPGPLLEGVPFLHG